jgi:hypothetical protein
LIAFAVFVMAGCVAPNEDSDRYTLSVNHDIPACGIEDPIVNISWLADTCASIAFSMVDYKQDCRIVVYKSKTKKDNRIIFDYYGTAPVDGGYTKVYTCAGNFLFSFYWFKAEASEDEIAFNEEYESVGVIWELQSLVRPSWE